jgi:hypothetical protein
LVFAYELTGADLCAVRRNQSHRSIASFARRGLARLTRVEKRLEDRRVIFDNAVEAVVLIVASKDSYNRASSCLILCVHAGIDHGITVSGKSAPRPTPAIRAI